MALLSVASRMALQGVWKQKASPLKAFVDGKHLPKKSLAQSIA
jgi:hypothetical protein